MKKVLLLAVLFIGVNAFASETTEVDTVICDIELVNNNSGTVSVQIVGVKNGQQWTAYSAGVRAGATVRVDMGNDYSATYYVYYKGPYSQSYTKHYTSGCGTVYL